ncbi:UNVERIFIED_CONTAM: hypothetical protein NCL1_27642 [Trichonephila clavipes]
MFSFLPYYGTSNLEPKCSRACTPKPCVKGSSLQDEKLPKENVTRLSREREREIPVIFNVPLPGYYEGLGHSPFQEEIQ